MRVIGVRRMLWCAVCAAAWCPSAFGNEYYIAPSGGSDSNNGSLGTPFATFSKAIGLAQPGDTIFARGGTYNLNARLQIQKSGSLSNPINLFAYPGETPILDFASNPATAGTSAGRGIELSDDANWWHIKGLTIQNAKDNGLYTEGDYGVFEQIVTRYNRDSGFQLHGTATNNLVLNSDSYENYDPQTVNQFGEPIPGENADGFAAKSSSVGPGNIFRGDRSWGNSDDGFDVYYTVNYGILVDNCWTFDNGIDIWGAGENYQGDGNGYKLGNPGGPSVVVNSLAVDNAHNGMDINGSVAAVKVYNSTSFRNVRNWRFDQKIPAQILKNNISYQGDNADNIDPAVSDTFNSWNGGVSLDDNDFESLSRFVNDVDLLKAPRQADGSLPDLGEFLHLATCSDLIDAGTPISFTFNSVTYNLPFNGLAPDLGAYETGVHSPALPGDYNGDNIVDASDYSVWRDSLGQQIELPNDETPGMVDADDYEVWKAHFGETLNGGAGQAASSVPEPASVLMAAIGILALGPFSRFRVAVDRVRREGR
jgi:Pel9A-like, right handed beta helix region